MEREPALQLGAAGLFGLLLEWLSKRRRDVAERRYRIWTCVLLCLMVQTSAAVLLQLSPAVRMLPDYLLLTFFCVTLYYKERLVFFDVVLKRGVFLVFSVLVFATFFLVRPTTAWGQWLLLAPLWLAGPWIYGVLARTIDRVWLRRRYTAVEAERRFVAAVQAAENEEDLRGRAAQALAEIFDAAADVRFGSVAAGEAAAGFIDAAIGAHGRATLSPRASSVPYLSDDRNLLQSLGRTLGVVLENVRFRAREEHLRDLASRAELKALRAQINPHFLFNALNAIAGLIHTRPELAEETVEQLAEVFRYTLRKSEKEWVRLDEEIEFVAAYLRVEEARFGERLQVKVSVDAAATSIPVPAMSIQPLVENAIKHGTSTVEGQGKVEVSVTLSAEGLCIEVCDNGPGFPTGFSLAAPGGGHGLRNIAERLSGYYGDSARISWENQAKGTMVRLQIPRRGAVARPSI
jgi:signal transduction histidine kinase